MVQPEAPKTPQFHMLPRTQCVDNALQEQRDRRVGLVLRQLDGCCHFVNELCLVHARPPPPEEGHHLPCRTGAVVPSTARSWRPAGVLRCRGVLRRLSPRKKRTQTLPGGGRLSACACSVRFCGVVLQPCPVSGLPLCQWCPLPKSVPRFP